MNRVPAPIMKARATLPLGGLQSRKGRVREISRITNPRQVHVDSRRMDGGQRSPPWQRIERRPQSGEAERVIHPGRKYEVKREGREERSDRAVVALINPCSSQTRLLRERGMST